MSGNVLMVRHETAMHGPRLPISRRRQRLVRQAPAPERSRNGADHDDGAQAMANQTIKADTDPKVLTRNKTLRCGTSGHDGPRFALDRMPARR
jgi:hypothetical protein